MVARDDCMGRGRLRDSRQLARHHRRGCPPWSRDPCRTPPCSDYRQRMLQLSLHGARGRALRGGQGLVGLRRVGRRESSLHTMPR